VNQFEKGDTHSVIRIYL